MKLNKIHIAAFGGLKNFELIFADGFNLIYGKNENGKTTVMEFIKMMFYGSKSKAREDIRGKYAPWSGERMAGSIDFEHGGTRYRIERTFMAGNATDKITLINLDMGTSEVFTGKTAIGEQFFGLSMGAFEKSVFINNTLSSTAGNEADGELNRLLSNISETGDEGVSYETVNKRISAAMSDLLTPTLRGGKIKKAEFELSELREERAKMESVYARRDTLEREIEALSQKESALFEQKKECFELLKNASEAELKIKLQEFIGAAEKYNELEKRLTLPNGTPAGREYTSKARTLLSEALALHSSLLAKQDELKRLEEDIAELSLKQQNGSDGEKSFLSSKRDRAFEGLAKSETELYAAKNELALLQGKIAAAKPQPNIAIIVIALALISIGLGAGLAVSTPLLSFAGVGVVMLMLGIVFKITPDTSALTTEEKAITEKILLLESELQSFRRELDEAEKGLTQIEITAKTDTSILLAKREEYIEAGAALTKKQADFARLRDAVISHLSPIAQATDISAAAELISKIEQDFASLEALRIEANYAAHSANCHSLEQAREKLELIKEKPVAALTKAEYQAKMDSISAELSELKNRLTALKTEAATAFSGLSSPAELDRKAKDKLGEISAMKSHYDALSIARDALSSAYGELRQGFSRFLDSRATQLFEKITDGKYSGVTVSKNFDISVQQSESFGTHSVAALSRGAADQAYCALRLALAEQILGENGKMPIIMDDIFAQYDDDRLLAALKFLEEYSQNNQAIFFTCHKDYTEKADKANIISL